MASFPRQTVAGVVSLEGAGLHSGQPVQVRIEPASEGIRFVCNGTAVQATPENVTDTSRCTRLGDVSTVEHLMAAFACAGVTDADVVLTSPELPALDGASLAYSEALREVGFETIGAASFGLFERVFFAEEPIRIGIAKGEGHWRFDFDTGERWPGHQSYECMVSDESFVENVAGARTFAFEEEVEAIRELGLAQGLDLSTALILGASGYANEAKWPDEPARHKLLDLIGDLYLAGVPPMFLNVVAVRSGHRTNVLAAARLATHVDWVR